MSFSRFYSLARHHWLQQKRWVRKLRNWSRPFFPAARYFIRANPSLEPSVVIDDGLHTYEAARNSFEDIFPHLVPGGTYWIEDLRGRDLLRMFDYLRKFGVAVKLFLFARQKSSSLLMVESR
jgi:hypothetical protein